MLHIGTRDSQLALWQSNAVKDRLAEQGIASTLVHIKSDGDTDLVTPLYAMGVQGVFTKALDAALLSGHIDIAVHSMKDVPVSLAKGIVQAAVLKRGKHQDIFVFGNGRELALPGNLDSIQTVLPDFTGMIASSSIRRRAQWLHYFPGTHIVNLRGNVNTRLQKVANSNWHGAIFAAAGLERINLRPSNAIDLHWMLPAPAQGAVMVVCREEDEKAKMALAPLNDVATAICTKAERDFLSTLMGGCSAPISALATITGDIITLKANIFSPDGKDKKEITMQSPMQDADIIGKKAGEEILKNGADALIRKTNQ